MTVDVVHWNPRRPLIPGLLGYALPVRRPVDNFGDLLGPLLVERIAADEGLEEPAEPRRLLTVGSILHFAKPGDTVWGTGINPKADRPLATPLDVRAVRGPVTQEALERQGIAVPAIYGDPALLWSRFWPAETYPTGSRQPIGMVPNFHDAASYGDDARVILPRGQVHDIVSRILRCDFIVASSLHGIVIAESYGIPARLVPSGTEPPGKYDDYYRGTGRPDWRSAPTVEAAVELGGEPAPVWDGDALLAAFPRDLWRSRTDSDS
ncbi:MAG TPA: polysaccharide pyruvyl transferase family protein [Pseudolysinimonas sp.]|jgi:pyruvyltransferase|nr:polysaccharide pyruvyl transferase family protein [Pseudolysinimonas sp.]